MFSSGFNVFAEHSNAKLLAAVKNRDVMEAKWAIENGADVNAANDNGVTPLYSAARNFRTEIAKLLIAAGADVNAKTENDNTPLHEAISAFEFNHDIIDLLLANGADPHAMNKKGQTPLQIVPGRNRKYLEQFCRQRLQAWNQGTLLADGTAIFDKI